MAKSDHPVAQAKEPTVKSVELSAAEEARLLKRKSRSDRLWSWLGAKPMRMITLASTVAAIVAAMGAVGATDLKYPVLGLVMTGSLNVAITDATTNQPLLKAKVTFGSASAVTDKQGIAAFKRVKLGHGQLVVHKPGYAVKNVPATAEPLMAGAAKVGLQTNGVKVVAHVTNLITGGSVEGVEVQSGEAYAMSNKSGRIELYLPLEANASKQTLTFRRDNYSPISVDVKVKFDGDTVLAKLVPAGKVYYQSDRAGKLDIYSSNLDGSGTEKVLEATGDEDDSTGILLNVNDPHELAIVSSREGRRSGYLHHDLYIFDTDIRKLTKIEEDVEFKNYRAWSGGVLVYEKTQLSTDHAGCNSIQTFEVASEKSQTLFEGKYGSTGCATIDLEVDGGVIFSVKNADVGHSGIFTSKLSGTPKRISETPSDKTVRSAKQTLLSESLDASGQTWESIKLGNFAITRLPNGSSSETNRIYTDSSDGSRSAFVDTRDGKKDLYVTDGKGGKEKQITSMGSVNQVVQWYGNNVVVFSSMRADENALYVISANGGTPVKVTDFYPGNLRTYGNYSYDK